MKIPILYCLCFSTLFAISSHNFINTKDCDQIIDKEFLKICYDYDLKSAKAVGYTLDGDLVNAVNISKRPNFNVELLLEEQYRISYSDYTNSGYDRGHLAPDAGFDWSQESLEATYSLANIIPQVRLINQRTWTKAEAYARFQAVERGKVNVLNIIKYAPIPPRIGTNAMAVSSGYYKVLYSDDQSYEECFYYQNHEDVNTTNDTLEQHLVSCKALYPQKPLEYSFLIPIITMLSQ
ncbi:DNA/RNA endonuclease G [hydrothermal vent metagenome]|uniref:DNA/RNA endonuclease G n=1 Tax=hydrothermal vent metagenome TaxID=652676 RepID=A0A1W1CWE0_9ZZZZ